MPENDLPPGNVVLLHMGYHVLNHLAQGGGSRTLPFPFTGIPNLSNLLDDQLHAIGFDRESHASNPLILVGYSGSVDGVAAIVRNWREDADRITLNPDSWVRVDVSSTLDTPVLWLKAEGKDERELTQIFPGIWATRPEYLELMEEYTMNCVIIRS